MGKYLTDPIIRKTDSGTRYYGTVIPATPNKDFIGYTITTVMGDRWDTLAYKYLGSPKYWYILAIANESVNGSIFIKPGSIVTIPEV